MTKNNIVVLAVTFLAVAGFYFFLYKDSFQKPAIQIIHTVRPRRSALARRNPNAPDDDINTITFAMRGDFKLTSVKVVPLAELETNRFAHPVWELISESNSAPVRAFAYGSKIRGMHPAVKGARPDPLIPDVTYRLLVETKSIKGQHDFKIGEESHLAQ